MELTLQKNILNKKQYIQGAWIALILIILGIIVEYLSGGKGVTMPAYPANLLILSVFVGYIFIMHFFWKSDIKKWLSSVPATVTAITAYSILVVLMGFIPQIDESAADWIRKTGLSHINRSWEFLFISVYLITILGLVILRRFKKFNIRNIAFFLNHAGIFIVISTASIASGDLQRLTVSLQQGQSATWAINAENKAIALPFEIKLDSFAIDYYTPQLIIFAPNTKLILNKAGIDYSIEPDKKFKFNDYTITVKQYINSGVRSKGTFIEKDTVNTEFAAFIEIKNKNLIQNAWISSGNYQNPSLAFVISDDLAFSLSLPEEKKYISYIDLASPKCGNLKNVKILVNFPVKYCGYNIYQQSFQITPHNNQKISILELVKDPWLPVIYVGLIMLTIGAILLFWLGKKIEK